MSVGFDSSVQTGRYELAESSKVSQSSEDSSPKTVSNSEPETAVLDADEGLKGGKHWCAACGKWI